VVRAYDVPPAGPDSRRPSHGIIICGRHIGVHDADLLASNRHPRGDDALPLRARLRLRAGRGGALRRPPGRLAARADMRAAPADDGLLNGRAAGAAWLALPAVYLEAVLEHAHLA